MLLVDTRVYVRLSTIDPCAKPVPKRATRERWNNPSLRNIERPQLGALLEHQAL